MARASHHVACFTALLLTAAFAGPAGATLATLDPGAFPDNTDLTNAYPGVQLIADVPATPPGDFVTNSTPGGEPSMFIMRFGPGSSLDGTWTNEPSFVRIFEARFAIPTSVVTLKMRDAGLDPFNLSDGVIEAYDVHGTLINTVTTHLTSTFNYQSVAIVDGSRRIRSIRAYGKGNGSQPGANLSVLQYEVTLECLDPGAFPDNTDLTSVYPGVQLIADIPATPPGDFVTNSTPSGEPSMFIMRFGPGSSLDGTWTNDPGFVRVFEARFASATKRVALQMRDAGMLPFGSSNGVLEAYDGGGALLGRVIEPLTSAFTYQTVIIASTSENIASIRAYGTGSQPGAGANVSELCIATPGANIDVPFPRDEGGGMRLSAAQPNPFGNTTSLSYDLPRTTLVMLRVHDVTGRTVRTLESRVEAAGRHLATWDGRNEVGARVAGGIYFLRLETMAGSRSEKVLLLP